MIHSYLCDLCHFCWALPSRCILLPVPSPAVALEIAVSSLDIVANGGVIVKETVVSKRLLVCSTFRCPLCDFEVWFYMNLRSSSSLNLSCKVYFS